MFTKGIHIMTHPKKAWLLILLLWSPQHSIFSAQHRTQKPSVSLTYEWLNPIRTLFTKLFAYHPSPIKNWREIYQGKEAAQKSIVDPVKSAQKFKIALQKAATKNKFMSNSQQKTPFLRPIGLASTSLN